METEVATDGRPSDAGSDEGMVTTPRAATPSTEEMEALYSEMDALNK